MQYQYTAVQYQVFVHNLLVGQKARKSKLKRPTDQTTDRPKYWPIESLRRDLKGGESSYWGRRAIKRSSQWWLGSVEKQSCGPSEEQWTKRKQDDRIFCFTIILMKDRTRKIEDPTSGAHHCCTLGESAAVMKYDQRVYPMAMGESIGPSVSLVFVNAICAKKKIT